MSASFRPDRAHPLPVPVPLPLARALRLKMLGRLHALVHAADRRGCRYTFIPFQGGYFGAKVMALPGWPECHIGDAMPKAVQEGGVEDVATG